MGNFSPTKDALSYTHVTKVTTCYMLCKNKHRVVGGAAARGCTAGTQSLFIEPVECGERWKLVLRPTFSVKPCPLSCRPGPQLPEVKWGCHHG